MFGHEIKNVYPICISKISFEKYIKLLRIKNGEIQITYLLKMSTGLSTSKQNKDKKHFCMNWLQSFSSLDVLENH